MPTTPTPRVLGRLQIARGPFEGARHELRIRVEEQQEVRVHARRALVARGRKAPVLRIPDHIERRRAREPVRGAVG